MDNQILITEQQQPKAKNPKKGSIVYIVAFVFFFFSFFMVECSPGFKKSITGMELVNGKIWDSIDKDSAKNSGNTVGESSRPTSVWAFIAFLCIVVGIPTAIFYNKKAALLSWVVGVVGVISMIILPVALYFRWHEEIDMNLIHFRFGYFAVLACLIAATYFCYQRYNEIFKTEDKIQ